MSAIRIDQDRLRNLVVPMLLTIASAAFLYYLITGKGDRRDLRDSLDDRYQQDPSAGGE